MHSVLSIFLVVMVFSGSIISRVFMVSRLLMVGDIFDGLAMVVIGIRTYEVSMIMESYIVEIYALENLQGF